MKKPLATMVPLLARGLAPTAAIASGLLSPSAMGAPGDLDPTFADVGRLTDIGFDGPAWSAEPAEEEDLIFAGGSHWGGGFYCGYYSYYECEYFGSNFVSRLSGTGAVDPGFAAAQLQDVEAFNVAHQSDGKVIAVGRTVERDGGSSLTIFRLEREGALDLTFGEGGIVRSTSTSGFDDVATAVAVQPDGRIVVAGSQSGQLIVMRLLENGTPDDTFGTSGIFLEPTAAHFLQRMDIVRTGNGGYRIIANSARRCSVVALTEAGALDELFGSAGIARIGNRLALSTQCNSMVAQSDDRLLLAGSEDGRGFVDRLLTNGERDPSFANDVIPATLQEATALAVGADDSVIVAGRGTFGVSGALIVRLQADGELDELFGNSGSSWIDLPADANTSPTIHDMTVLPDGRIIAVGGAAYDQQPFAVRLFGESGGEGPGVVGVKYPNVSAGESSQEALITLRRTGGSSGRVSVAYQTMASDGNGSATAGADYTEVTGRVTWEDGDTAEKQFVVPIASDGFKELSEVFVVALDDVQGGAGLGTSSASVDIESDEPPPPPASSGGGALGLLTLLLLAAGRCLPSSWNVGRSNRASG